jgi:hypothetical protein
MSRLFSLSLNQRQPMSLFHTPDNLTWTMTNSTRSSEFLGKLFYDDAFGNHSPRPPSHGLFRRANRRI